MSDNVAHRPAAVRLRIAVLADTHLEPEQAGAIPRSNRRCRAAVGWIKALKADLVVHLGDVVHPLPSAVDQAQAFDAADAILAGLAAPLLVTPGNHDIGDKPNPSMPAAAVRIDWAAAWTARVGPLWRSHRIADCRIVLVCASLLGSGDAAEAAQWNWLSGELEEARALGERIFLFTHYPPFIRTPGEPGHYDNLEPTPRARLLDLARQYAVEAILSGHAHAMFFNGAGETLLHVVPSVAFARRDYAELSRVAPGEGEEFGRNEIGRLGFSLLDVLDRGHALHPMMTEGSEELVPPAAALLGIVCHPRLGGQALLGVPLHHPWGEVVALPTNPPTAPFRRRLARDDRTVQLLWRLGLSRLRIPREDLDDPSMCERILLLAGQGFRFWLATDGVPDAGLLDRIGQLGSALEGWEVTVAESAIGEVAAALLATSSRLPAQRILAPMLTTASRAGATASTLFVGGGLPAGEPPELLRRVPTGAFTGWMARIEQSAPVETSIAKVAAHAAAWGCEAAVTVCLMPERPDASWTDDDAIAERVTEAARAAQRYPDVKVWLDTFLDIDRGYYVRNGLADRRLRPRAAGYSLARVQAMPC